MRSHRQWHLAVPKIAENAHTPVGRGRNPMLFLIRVIHVYRCQNTAQNTYYVKYEMTCLLMTVKISVT